MQGLDSKQKKLEAKESLDKFTFFLCFFVIDADKIEKQLDIISKKNKEEEAKLKVREK